MINVDVSYEDEDPQGDWYVTITIPRQDNWEDTRDEANKVAKRIEGILNG